MSFFRLFLFFGLCLFITSSASARAELLKTSDVPQVMKQIFNQHVDQKEMTPKTLKMGFKVFIDQFDPNRIYLLESETAPYLSPTESSVNKTLKDYQNNNFQSFEELNKTIQNAIYRARTLRESIKDNSRPLFHMTAPANTDDDWNDPDLKRPFPKSTQELKSNIQDDLVNFIRDEKYKFGDAVIINNQPQTLALFEKSLRSQENNYLYIDENGKALSPEEKANAFSLHILKSLASSLDAHTSFYNTSEANDLKMRLQKNVMGIGVGLKKSSNGTISISSLVKDGPAAKSNKVLIDDIVIAIDGKFVAEKSFSETLDLLRNSTAAETRLLLERNGQKPFEVSLKREDITLQDDRVDVAYEKFGGGIIGVITLHSFYQGNSGVTSEDDMRRAIEKLNKTGELKGLIVDLRDNSGGFLIQAVKVAGLFITNGVVVISKYFNGEEHFYRDVDGKNYYDGPLIILTSRATASAAEIVAQALQDYGVALIVGDAQTYGKGTIQNQTVTKGSGTSLFKVTVGKYYTPSGKTTQLGGVKPDILVPGSFNYEHIGEKYLTATISADTIPEDYNDSLADLTPLQKKWFQSHYLPTLQQKQSEWSSMLSELQLKSSERIANNRGYQAFLKRLQNKGKPIASHEASTQNVDYQLREALNIVHDMVEIRASKAHREVVLENIKPLKK